LLENHLINLSVHQKRAVRQQTCWQVLRCANVLCPVHGKYEVDCWLIPKTRCAGRLIEDFFQKLADCLTCSYFRARGESHPDGWNRFLSEQLHTYNRAALERIYQKEESFVEILNRTPDGLFTTDHEWRITYFNPAAEKITGFSAYDAVGMYCRDVFKNSICEHDCALKRAVAEGRDIHNREYEITNIDGRKIPIICSTSAFRDATGRVTGGLEIFKDISDIKRLQEEIAAQRNKYRRIFEGSHDMIYTTNWKGDIIDVNPAGVEMMGYRHKEELLQKISARELYRNPEDRERFLEAITSRGYVKDYEVDFARRDGTPLRVLISSRLYEDKESGDIEYEGIIKDITRRKNNEEVINQRNRELSMINSIAAALNLTMDLGHILETTLQKVIKVLGITRGGLFLIDREQKAPRLWARFGLPEKSACGQETVRLKDRMLMAHLMEAGAFVTPEASFPPFRASLGIGAEGNELPLTCFLISFKGHAVGFFGLDLPPERVLSQHEIHLLGSLGNFLGGAIENTRMMETIRRHRRELTRLTGKLFQTQEEERRRIARELHDETGQSLTAVKLALERLEEKLADRGVGLGDEIVEIGKMVRRTSAEIRRLSYNLHPTLLSDLGLEPALNLYFSEIRKNSGLEIEFIMVGVTARLDADFETVLYRFAQEALTNTLKHSGAEKFRLSIIKSYPKIIFLAEDDGVGFDAEIIGRDRRSLGLIGMRERAALLGGSFHLKSNPGEGTRIRIEIPLREEPDDA
jgi:PAS domain S-box-containing protein